MNQATRSTALNQPANQAREGSQTKMASYDRDKTYDWNYEHTPAAVPLAAPPISGAWNFCGLATESPLGVAAGPLLNGRWVLYYASLGFDVLTYKTVRTVERACYPWPNLVPVECGDLVGGEDRLRANDEMRGTWAVSFGMPSRPPGVWRADVADTRRRLPANKVLSVSVVATHQEGWTLDDLAADYAQAAVWAVESGADVIECNFSCPNVSTCDGQLYQHPLHAGQVAARVKAEIGRTPLVIKIGHLTDAEQAEQLVLALAPRADALAMTNSVATTVIDPQGELCFEGQKRGICGQAIRQASLDQTVLVADTVRRLGLKLKLIGVGGAASAADVHAYLRAGAHAVHLATAAMVDPSIAIEIRRQWQT